MGFIKNARQGQIVCSVCAEGFSKGYLVALSGLDANRYVKVLLWKRNIDFSALITDNSMSQEKAVVVTSEFGDHKVTKLRQAQKRLSENELVQIIEYYKSGMSTYQLAKKYKCHRLTISHNLIKHGVIVTNKKIAEQEIAEIVRLYEYGHKLTEIAEQFQLSCSTILKCLHDNNVRIRTRWDY